MPTLDFELLAVCSTCGCVVADIATHKQYHAGVFADGTPVALYEDQSGGENDVN